MKLIFYSFSGHTYKIKMGGKKDETAEERSKRKEKEKREGRIQREEEDQR